MRVITLVLVVGVACASSPAWAMHQKGGQRQAEGSKLIGRLAEHAIPLARLNPNLRFPEFLESSMRRTTRASLATGIWGGFQDYLKAVLGGENQRRIMLGEEYPESRRRHLKFFANEYWRFELLLRELTPEILATGVTQDEIDESTKWFRSAFADMEVELVFPNADYFSDVPEGHWADEAIHNMRRAGVLHGYPDGEFRPG